jgi:ssDNA-binding Zn-finger/Zn-ribbon topoisomerase 1
MENNLEFYRKMKINLGATVAKIVGRCDHCGQEGDLIDSRYGYFHRECLEVEERDRCEPTEDLNPETHDEYDLNPETAVPTKR